MYRRTEAYPWHLHVDHIVNKSGKTIKGAQSVTRALDILKLLAKEHEQGLELSELVKATGLQRTTVYRLVSALVEKGFVERDTNKRYRLGIDSMQLGLASMSRAPLLEICKPAMQVISRLTQDTSYLIVRNGDYAHCLHRIDGSPPLKTQTILVGGLRLLGLGTGGQTLLALLSDQEIDALYGRHSLEYEKHAMTRLGLHQAAQRVRRNQIAETKDLITHGLGGVGVAFTVTQGSYAAISVAAPRQRMTPDRTRWVGDIICAELAKIGFAKAVRS